MASRTNNSASPSVSPSVDELSAQLAELKDMVVVKKSQRQTDIEEALEQLAKLGGKLTAEEDIVFSGKKLVLPETMSLQDAIRFLNEKLHEDEQRMSFNKVFNFRPWDGAHATMCALKKAFGAVTQRSIQSFFGEIPPEMRTINIGPNETTQVPWGRMGVAHLAGLDLYLGSTRHREWGICFVIQAEGPRKYRHHVEGLFTLIEEELKNNSIYRGKAFDGQEDPQFLELSSIDPSKIVYSDAAMEQLEANVWSVLRYPDVLSELGIPLKRAVLLEGPYGTGKTLAAYLTAKVATENGWSFLLCRPGQDDLMEVMNTARLYQPAVVFFEDVDSVSNAGKHIPRLLDIFDGIKAKDTKIMAVLTTNHVEEIHKGMVRPGRIDAVIHIGELDPAGLRRLVESVVPEEHLDIAIDWDAVTGAMEGFLPAFAKESIDRAMRYNVARNQGKVTELSTQDFVAAAKGLRPQLELMAGAKDKVERRDIEVALQELVSESAKEVVAEKLQGAAIRDSDGDWMYSVDLVN